MQSVKRWLFVGLSLCMFVLTGVRGWAVPFRGIAAGSPLAGPQDQPKQDQPKQEEPRSSTFTGTIVKDGEQFVLHDVSGGVYTLDDSDRAKNFEGKAVRVTGKLDMDARMIHVENIEVISA